MTLLDMNTFGIARLPEIRFGAGARHQLGDVIAGHASTVLLVTGAKSWRKTEDYSALIGDLVGQGIEVFEMIVNDEPSPDLIDENVQRFHVKNIDMVIGVGGGSVLDAAKAMAGLLPSGDSVMEYLEGVGKGMPYLGPALPWIAVPTTAGTGSEATKNAVLSRRGEGGFKKSFRHPDLVAKIALVDPEFLATCPKALIAANGMDAFTQLLESYVSTGANPMTDALAWSGMEAFRDGLMPAWEDDHPDQDQGYQRLAYASLQSGITLAQTGLGSVHGLASPLGAFFPIPHGVVCGTLLAEATAVNIQALRERDPDGPGLRKYAQVGKMLSRNPHQNQDQALDSLMQVLNEWDAALKLPRLSEYGMTEADLDRVVANCRGGSMQTNPLKLTDEELKDLLVRRL